MKIRYFACIILFISLLTTLSVSAETSSVAITLKSGDVKTVEITAISKIYFQDGNLIVNMKADGQSSISTAISDISRVSFSTGSGSVSQSLSDNSLVIIPSDTQVMVSGITSPTNLEIYSINGAMALSTSLAQDGAVSIDTLPQGVYIIKVSSQVIKYIKK